MNLWAYEYIIVLWEVVGREKKLFTSVVQIVG